MPLPFEENRMMAFTAPLFTKRAMAHSLLTVTAMIFPFGVAGCGGTSKCPVCKGEGYVWGVSPQRGDTTSGIEGKGGWQPCPRCKR